jgi:hypothetical protein
MTLPAMLVYGFWGGLGATIGWNFYYGAIRVGCDIYDACARRLNLWLVNKKYRRACPLLSDLVPFCDVPYLRVLFEPDPSVMFSYRCAETVFMVSNSAHMTEVTEELTRARELYAEYREYIL